MSVQDQVTLKKVYEAAKRIKPYIAVTPLWHSPSLGGNVYLKMENLHEIGAFKIRGAANKMLSLTTADQQKGVTTFSTGNHGLAVASLAGELNIRAVICISNRVPDVKVNRLKRLGAEVVKVGESQNEAEKHADELRRRDGLTVIPPFDDQDVIAGQGTIGLELIEAMPDIETVVIPVSGGGLFSGISFVLKKYNPAIRVIGVSMEKSAVMYESIQAGKIMTIPESDTYADSLLGGIGENNRYTFQMVQDYIDDFILLTEEDIASGMAFMLNEHQCAVEGAAAITVGTILRNKIDPGNSKAACIISGRNVDTSVILKVCKQ